MDTKMCLNQEETRNKLFVRLTIKSNTNNINNGTYEISAYSSTNYYNNNLLISATKAEWEKGIEITGNNLTLGSTIYFRGRTGGNRNNPTYATDNRTVKQLIEGTNINIG